MEDKKVVIVIEDGIINLVKSTDTSIQVEIIDIDTDYTTSEERRRLYEEFSNLHNCQFLVKTPGWDDEE